MIPISGPPAPNIPIPPQAPSPGDALDQSMLDALSESLAAGDQLVPGGARSSGDSPEKQRMRDQIVQLRTQLAISQQQLEHSTNVFEFNEARALDRERHGFRNALDRTELEFAHTLERTRDAQRIETQSEVSQLMAAESQVFSTSIGNYEAALKQQHDLHEATQEEMRRKHMEDRIEIACPM